MPRKLRLRSGPRGVTRPARPAQLICQCDQCGGLVDPRYGSSDDSWCPNCGAVGSVIAQEGQIPIPALYGGWVREERKKRPPAQTAQIPPFTHPPTPASFPTLTEDSTMKTAKTHTGTYSCLDCMVEFDLVAETRLKCDDCKGALLRGALEDLCDEDGGTEDDPA